MIKTIEIESDFFEKGNVQEVYDYFKEKEFLGYDSETTGFDCHTKELICIQIGDYDNQWVIHPDYLQSFKPLLENKTLLGQNIKFDLKFLYKQNIWPRSVWDTFLAESVLKCGLKQAKKSLAAIAQDRLGIDIDKSIRDNIWDKGLTKEVIEYSANDVKYLEQIKASQTKELVRNGLERALDIENEFVLCLAYIEYSGMKLDTKKWAHKIKSDLINRQDSRDVLDNYIRDNKIEMFISDQLSMFEEKPEVTINWRSPVQVIKLFEHLGIPVTIVEKGVIKKTVDSKHLEKHVHKHPFIEKYLTFKKYEKTVTTYGQNFIDQINPVTGRVHTNFRQILDTSRTSSGGKNKNTKEEYLNFQNIPAEKGTRECFISEKGSSLIVSDYSGQEQVILANKCLDKNLLEFYDNNLGDMHSFIAQKMYPELSNVSLTEIAKEHPDKRQNAKIAGFTIAFGGNELTISGNQNIPLHQAKNIIDSYFTAFPGMKHYFDLSKQEGLRNGYILISENTGRKSYIEGYDKYLKLRKEITPLFWDKWKMEKLNPTDQYEVMKEKISTYFKIKGAIERKSLNFPIQGTAAEVSKIAGTLFFKWILRNGYQNKVLIPNFVHDEYVAEAPDDMAFETSKALKEFMERAGALYCNRVKLVAEPKITKRWSK